MADEDQERRRKLAELRRIGVLSDDEFKSANARLRTQRVPETPDEDRPSVWSDYWPAFLGFAILVLMIVGLVVYGRMTAASEDVDLNIAVSRDASDNLLNAAPTGAEACSSEAGFGSIKDQIFDRAQTKFGGDPGPLDSLRRAVGVRMQYPMLRAVHQDNKPTDCGGHLLLDLPPSVRAAFEGLPALEADVEYAVQPAADGTMTLVNLAGADFIVDQLAVAANLVGGQGKTEAGAASSAPVHGPSFDCRGAATNVERIICQDDQLAQLDVQLADRYLSLRRQFSGPDWQPVGDSQRAFLRRRAACPDIACLRDAYAGQIRYLDGLFPEEVH